MNATSIATNFPLVSNQTAIVRGKQIVYCSGDDADEYNISWLGSFCTSTKTSQTLNGTNSAPLCSCHSMIYYVVNDSLHVFGGLLNQASGKEQGKTNDHYEYRFATKTWYKLAESQEAPFARNSHSATLHKQYMYVLGGFDGKTLLSDHYKYHIPSGTWQQLSDCQVNDTKVPRSAHSCLLYGDAFIVFGGSYSGQKQTTYWYDIHTDEWSEYKCKDQSWQPEDRYGHGAAIFKHKLFVFGGSVFRNGIQDDLCYLDLLQQKWHTVQVLGSVMPLRYMTMSCVGNKLYIFGGEGKASKNANVFEIEVEAMGPMEPLLQHMKRNKFTDFFQALLYQASVAKMQFRAKLFPSIATMSATTPKKNVVRYMTEDTMKKLVAKLGFKHAQDVLELDFSQQFKNERFTTIENLHQFVNLQRLVLRGSGITKMDNLSALSKLQELDLSNNSICKIENLDNLIKLQVLRLDANQITRIPSRQVFSSQKSLRELHLSNNKISCLEDLKHLRCMEGMSLLSLIGNPIHSLPHCTLFVAFYLPMISILDQNYIDPDARQEATQRYASDDIHALERTLESKIHELDEQRLKNKVLSEELAQLKSSNANQTTNVKMEQLEKELHRKNQMFEKKSRDYTKVSETLFALRQQIEYLQIDNPTMNIDLTSYQIQTTPIRTSPIRAKHDYLVEEQIVSLRTQLFDIDTQLQEGIQSEQSMKQTLDQIESKLGSLQSQHGMLKQVAQSNSDSLQSLSNEMVLSQINAKKSQLNEQAKLFELHPNDVQVQASMRTIEQELADLEATYFDQIQSSVAKETMVDFSDSFNSSLNVSTVSTTEVIKLQDAHKRLSHQIKEQQLLNAKLMEMQQNAINSMKEGDPWLQIADIISKAFPSEFSNFRNLDSTTLVQLLNKKLNYLVELATLPTTRAISPISQYCIKCTEKDDQLLGQNKHILTLQQQCDELSFQQLQLQKELQQVTLQRNDAQHIISKLENRAEQANDIDELRANLEHVEQQYNEQMQEMLLLRKQLDQAIDMNREYELQATPKEVPQEKKSANQISLSEQAFHIVSSMPFENTDIVIDTLKTQNAVYKQQIMQLDQFNRSLNQAISEKTLSIENMSKEVEKYRAQAVESASTMQEAFSQQQEISQAYEKLFHEHQELFQQLEEEKQNANQLEQKLATLLQAFEQEQFKNEELINMSQASFRSASTIAQEEPSQVSFKNEQREGAENMQLFMKCVEQQTVALKASLSDLTEVHKCREEIIQQLTNEKNTLEQQVKQLYIKRDSLVHSTADLEQSKTMLSNTVQQLNAELFSTNQKLNLHKSSIKEMEEAMHMLKLKLSPLQVLDQLSQWEKDLLTRAKQLNTTHAQHDIIIVLRKDVLKLDEHRKASEAKLKSAIDKCKQLEEQIATQRKQIKHMEDAVLQATEKMIATPQTPIEKHTGKNILLDAKNTAKMERELSAMQLQLEALSNVHYQTGASNSLIPMYKQEVARLCHNLASEKQAHISSSSFYRNQLKQKEENNNNQIAFVQQQMKQQQVEHVKLLDQFKQDNNYMFVAQQVALMQQWRNETIEMKKRLLGLKERDEQITFLLDHTNTLSMQNQQLEQRQAELLDKIAIFSQQSSTDSQVMFNDIQGKLADILQSTTTIASDKTLDLSPFLLTDRKSRVEGLVKWVQITKEIVKLQPQLVQDVQQDKTLLSPAKQKKLVKILKKLLLKNK